MTPTVFMHDVFVSYRINDNKAPGREGDGWVTEFVNHLTTELESLVKGGVSIYFDKDEHHGLREHHQVEESIDDRLRTLIFIPVLSRTYCEVNSYAWKNEFLSFLDLAEKDEVGSTIRLHNGNVSSRVLPICIHDLDQSDIRLFETELKGKLRSINFVFKSPGVNRPLRAHEEDPLKNANQTFYRDQINKLANAINEIISSVRSGEKIVTATPTTKKISPILDFELPTTRSVKSIAVMPLVFKSHNPEDEFLSQGFAEDLFTSLRHIRALRLSIHGLSTLNGDEKVMVSDIHSSMLLTGSMTTSNGKVGVNVQLKQTNTGAIVWTGDYNCNRDKLFAIRPAIVTQICDSLGVELKEQEQDAIQYRAEASPAAMELYWKGRFHWRKRGNDLLTSLDCFQQAADLAPGFGEAYAGVANACVLLGYYGMIPLKESISQCKEAALNALRIDPTLIEAYYPLAYVSLCHELTWPEIALKFKKVFGINANADNAKKKFLNCLTQITCGFEEAEEDPIASIPHYLQAYSLMNKGKYDEGLKVAKIAIEKDEGSFMAHRAAGLCYLNLGYSNEAIETLSMAAQLSNRNRTVLFDLIGAYAVKSKNEEAESIMDEAMEYSNSLPAKINDFFFQMD